MPGKARRVASRQAQLGRRRKRQQNRPEDDRPGVPHTKPAEEAEPQGPANLSTVPESPAQESSLPESSVIDAPEPPAPTERPAARPSRPHRLSPVAARTADGDLTPARGGARGRRDRITAQANIGAEIKRIVAMSSTVLVIIIVLGIVL